MARAVEPPLQLAVAPQDAPHAVGHGAPVAAADEAAGAEERVGDQVGRTLLPAGDLVEQFHGGGYAGARCHVEFLLSGRLYMAWGPKYSYWRACADHVSPRTDPSDRAGDSLSRDRSYSPRAGATRGQWLARHLAQLCARGAHGPDRLPGGPVRPRPHAGLRAPPRLRDRQRAYRFQGAARDRRPTSWAAHSRGRRLLHLRRGSEGRRDLAGAPAAASGTTRAQWRRR